MYNPEDEDQTPPESNPDTSKKDIFKPILLAAALVVVATLAVLGIKQHYIDPATVPAVVATESTMTTAIETTTAAATTTESPAEADTVTAYITEHGTVYHIWRSCQYIRNKSDYELRILTDEEAEDQGYRVCSRCG